MFGHRGLAQQKAARSTAHAHLPLQLPTSTNYFDFNFLFLKIFWIILPNIFPKIRKLRSPDFILKLSS